MDQATLTPDEKLAIVALEKLLPYVKNAPAGFMNLNNHDLKVIIFHAGVALLQTYLIGAKIEFPTYAPIIQTAAEILRRLIV